MTTGFGGFPPQAITFFRGLRRHNRREWFTPRKQIFLDAVRAPMEALVTALNADLIRYAPDYVTDPDKAIYRFYRDTRFSEDKTPYKNHIAAIFPRRGTVKHRAAGYYFSVSDQEIEVAGGLYMPQQEELAAVRRHLAGNHAEFGKIVADRVLRKVMGELEGDRLSRVPTGFSSEHPAASLLKYKQLYFFRMLDPALLTTPSLFTEIVMRFRALTPFVEFLNRPLAPGRTSRSCSI